MDDTPIVQDIRQIRKKITEKFEGDIRKYVDYLIKREKEQPSPEEEKEQEEMG